MPYSDIAIASRKALLDAADALGEHLSSLVLVGAQAIYLYTRDTVAAIALTTKDSDIALIPELLGADPKLQTAMESAGFSLSLDGIQGKWINREGIPVDLLAPEGLPGNEAKGKRGARIEPHSKTAAHSVKGLEGIAVDTREMVVDALDPEDKRTVAMKVAGPSTLVVAKTFKICERIEEVEQGKRDRTQDKDAHDMYRLMGQMRISEFEEGFGYLLADERTQSTTRWAVEALSRHGRGVDSRICQMVGRAEEGVGDPERSSELAAALIENLLDSIQT